MRNLQLDILRAIAVILVIMHHKFGNLYLPSPFEQIAFFGWAGVDLFFVLSGFLIAGLLFDEYKRNGKVEPGRFLIRRAFKIYPAFFALLLFQMAFDIKEHRAFIWGNILVESFFLQNYLPGYSGNSHTWSLAVEEHFYLLVALVFYLLPKIKRRISFTYLVIAVSVICLALRTYVSLRYPFTQRTHGFPTHARIDSLLFGVWLSYVFNFKPQIKEWLLSHATLLFVLGCALISPGFIYSFEDPFMTSIGFTLMYLGFGGVLIFALSRKVPEKGIVAGFLLIIGYIGQHSYSIYLWHLFIRARFNGILINKHWIDDSSDIKSFCWYLGNAIVIGILMARAIEFPFLRLREKLFPSEVKNLSQAPKASMQTS